MPCGSTCDAYGLNPRLGFAQKAGEHRCRPEAEAQPRSLKCGFSICPGYAQDMINGETTHLPALVVRVPQHDRVDGVLQAQSAAETAMRRQATQARLFNFEHPNTEAQPCAVVHALSEHAEGSTTYRGDTVAHLAHALLELALVDEPAPVCCARDGVLTKLVEWDPQHEATHGPTQPLAGSVGNTAAWGGTYLGPPAGTPASSR